MALKQRGMRACNLFFSYSSEIDSYLSDKRANRVVSDGLTTPKLFNFALMTKGDTVCGLTYTTGHHTEGTLWKLQDIDLLEILMKKYSDRFSMSTGCVDFGGVLYNTYLLREINVGQHGSV